MKFNLFWSLSFVVGVIYAANTAIMQVPFGDSSELVAAGFHLGVPHPSGYPLSNLILWLVTRLSWLIDTQYLAHFVAALQHALTVGVVYLIGVELICFVFETKKITNTVMISAAFGALGLGFSRLFWLYSHLYEVMPLNDLLVSLFILFLIRIYRQRKTDGFWNLSCFFMVLGLMTSHHQLSWVVAVPVLGGLLWWLRPLKKLKFFGYGLGFATAIFILSCASILLMRPDVRMSWHVERSFIGLVQFILRRDYSGVIAANGEAVGAYLKFGSIAEHVTTLWFYLRQSFTSYGYHLIVAVLGIAVVGLSKISQQLKYSLLTITLLSTIGIGAYLIVPVKSDTSFYYQIIGMTERMYLMGYVLASAFCSVGVYFLICRLKLRLIGVCAVLVLYLLALMLSNRDVVNLRNYSSYNDYGLSLLGNLRYGAIVVCFSDYSCFGLQNAQAVGGVRTDVVVVPAIWQMQNFVRSQYQSLFHYSYPDHELELAMMIAQAVADGQDVFLAEEPESFVKRYGFDGRVFDLVPFVYSRKVVRDFQPLPVFELPVFFQTNREVNYIKSFDLYLKEFYLKNAEIFAGHLEKKLALSEVDKAIDLFPFDLELRRLRYQLEISELLEVDKFSGAIINEKQSLEQLILAGDTCFEIHDYGCSWDHYLAAALIDPGNLEAHHNLLELFQALNLMEMVVSEQEIIRTITH